MREKVVNYLHVFGLFLDPAANLDARFGKAGVISTKESKGCVMVVPTNEELMIALDTAHLTGMEL